jgi:hypothetical protein
LQASLGISQDWLKANIFRRAKKKKKGPSHEVVDIVALSSSLIFLVSSTVWDAI